MAATLERRTGFFRGWRFCAAIAAVLILAALVLYRDFLFGPKTLLFSEFGSDSLNVFYPFYTLLSDYLRQVGVPSWTFRIAMGQDLYSNIGNLLLVPIIWLPKTAIAKALIYQYLVYVLVAGLVFGSYLASRGLQFGSCLLGALLLSFSAYMCAGSCWPVHAQEVVLFSLLLLSAERAVVHGRWLGLTLVVCLIGFLGSFHFYLSALFLCWYVPLRLFERYGWQPRALPRIALILAAAAFLGVALTAIFGLDNFYALRNSPRGSGLTSKVGTLSSFPIFGLEPPLHYISAGLRLFGNDMLGTQEEFNGWHNYFESPFIYCGLLTLLIFPQTFVGATRRHRIVYTIFLGAALVVTIFPWFRYLCWAFQGNYFRILALFAVFAIVTLSMAAFSRYIEAGRFNLWLLGATTIALVGTLYLPIEELNIAINQTLRPVVALVLIGYAVLLAVGQIMRKQRIVAWTLIALSAVELLYLDHVTLSGRHAITKQQLRDGLAYNDGTPEVLRDLNSSDQSFFRITKTWGSSPTTGYPSLNDSMVYDYYGTTAYSSFNNVNYSDFLIAAGAVAGDVDASTHWSAGLLARPVVSTFACEKYVLTGVPEPYQGASAYEFMKRVGVIYVFQNKLSLPLGLIFESYFPESEFFSQTENLRVGILLHAVVLPDKMAPDYGGLRPFEMSELKEIADIVPVRRSSALQMHSFSQTKIEGSAHLNGKGILVVQTPFDPGWQAREDGHAVPVLRVDAGLLGVALDPGDHEVELHYRPPFLIRGAIVSAIALFILVVTYWRWPQVALPRLNTAE